MTEVLNTVGKMIQGVLNITFRVLDGLDGTELIFSAFVVVAIYRMLLVPLIGGTPVTADRFSRKDADAQAVTGAEKAQKGKKENG